MQDHPPDSRPAPSNVNTARLRYRNRPATKEVLSTQQKIRAIGNGVMLGAPFGLLGALLFVAGYSLHTPAPSPSTPQNEVTYVTPTAPPAPPAPPATTYIELPIPEFVPNSNFVNQDQIKMQTHYALCYNTWRGIDRTDSCPANIESVLRHCASAFKKAQKLVESGTWVELPDHKGHYITGLEAIWDTTKHIKAACPKSGIDL